MMMIMVMMMMWHCLDHNIMQCYNRYSIRFMFCRLYCYIKILCLYTFMHTGGILLHCSLYVSKTKQSQ